MKSSVSNRQIFLICLISILGFGIFGTANMAVRYMSTSAWLAILLAAIVFLVPTALLALLSMRYEGDTIYEYSKKAAGNVAGSIFSAVFALFYLVFAGLAVSYFSHIVSMWILPNTSFRLIAAFIMLVCAYALARDLTSTVRLVSFIGTLAVITVIAVRLTMLFFGDMSNLLPLYEQKTASAGLTNGMLGCTVFFFGIGILAIISHTKNGKGVVGAALFGVLAAGVILMLVSAACVSVLGPLQVGMYTDTMVLAMKAFDISYVTFIQRADIIFIVTWTMLILSSVCCTCYIPYVYVKSIMPSRRNGIGIILVCVLIFAISMVPQSMEQALYCADFVCKTLGVAALFVVPIIILAVSGVRHETKK